MKITFEVDSIRQARQIINAIDSTDGVYQVTEDDGGMTDDEVLEILSPSAALDVEGLPWDHRIHASSKERTAKGVWKRRRGVEDDVYDSITAELRGLPSPVNTAAVFGGNPVPAPPAPVEPELTFPEVVRKVVAAIGDPSKNLTREQVDTTLTGVYGVSNLAQLGSRPDLWTEVIQALGA